MAADAPADRDEAVGHEQARLVEQHVALVAERHAQGLPADHAERGDGGAVGEGVAVEHERVVRLRGAKPGGD